MDLDRFLTKYVLELDRPQARRDLAGVLANLSDDDRGDLARHEGRLSAFEDAQAALRTEVTAERFGWWLRERLAEIRGTGR